jgi:hypothetical protein
MVLANDRYYADASGCSNSNSGAGLESIKSTKGQEQAADRALR